MSDYSPPVEDIVFVLRHIADLESLMELDGFSQLPMDEVEGILEEAGRFMVAEVLPTDRVGDTTGAKLQADSSVAMPDGFDKAYKELVKAGWGSITFDAEWGGGGLPGTLGMAISEMLTATNMAFSLCPLLTHGAINAIEAHGSEEQKSFWLPNLVSGKWSGTMNLTEPNAGSDVGALTAKAKPEADGTYKITGQKIFITYGEHELAENIIHLVLARVEGAPPGTKGISLFIVPKFLVNADGTLGEKNAVTCLSLEEKMGIHASPTCVMEYGNSDGGATGYLIGEENQGMAQMFTMMNSARLGVGNSGIAISERVYQKSLNYAKERLQGRRPETQKGDQSPIIEHPDVKRNLLYIKSQLEAMRCLVYYNSALVDLTRFGKTQEDRTSADERAGILTPLSKAWSTDVANEIASVGIQIHGGAGYIEETGIAQHYRDIRIAAIYEGTNGIQAADLVARKLPIRNGEAMEELLLEIEKDVKENKLDDLSEPINDALSATRASNKYLLECFSELKIDAALSGATPYLELLSKLVAGWLMAKSAEIARTENYPKEFAEEKSATAEFFCKQILPTATALAPAIMAGDEILNAGINV